MLINDSDVPAKWYLPEEGLGNLGCGQDAVREPRQGNDAALAELTAA